MTPIELLNTTEMAEADRLAIASGIPGIDLMEVAGRAIAEAAERLATSGQIIVICGPGNNGGDGFVAARLLRAWGREVQLGLLGPVSVLKGDAAAAAARWAGPLLSLPELDLRGAALVIDALFGAGLARDLDGLARATVERVNGWSQGTGRPVLAVDVPSGLDGTTGQVRGVAIEATQTVTFFRLKPGHLLMPGPERCGEVKLAQIGIPDRVLDRIAPRVFANAPALWARHLPVPQRDGHKYSRGHALVVSGGAWSSGAARLCALAGLRAGAGLVTLASPRPALTINASHLTSVMITPCDDADELGGILSDPRKNALVMGPGLGIGEATAALVRVALKPRAGHRALVLDADALTAFAGRACHLRDTIASSGVSVVLTPHDGEFARLFNAQGFINESISEPESENETLFHSRLERARNAASAMGAILLLKGPDTVVAHPDGRASIGTDLPPWLATAGSGDVLAGMIGGLLAQGMAPFEAASAAVWLHGAAARAFGPGLISEDLPDMLPTVFEDLYEELGILS